MLRLDGAFGEGGGQILRSALTLSLLTGRPFELINIRAKRPKPGLRPQHLTCVKAAQKISQAQVSGAQKGSLYLRFEPGPVRSGSYVFDIGTAGATGLVFQTIALPLALAGGGKLTLKGGTHVPHAPCYHYLEKVYAPILHLLGYTFDLSLVRYGFYPMGGGEMKAQISPKNKPSSFFLTEPYQTKEVEVYSVVSADLPSHIRTRQAKRAAEMLSQKGFVCQIRLEKAHSPSPGTVVFLLLAEKEKRAGFFSLGKKGKPAEKVAEEAVKEFFDFYQSQAALDPYLSDQVLLPLPWEGCSFRFTSSCLTRHFFTNLWVIQQFLPDFRPTIQGEEGTAGLLSL